MRAQVVGNSAAVQANIIVPGMAGTRSSVDIGHTTRGTHTAGVGYQRGEPYEKWGRFACEMPASRDSCRRSPGRRSWKSPRRRPRSSDGTEADSNRGQEDDGAVGGGSSDSSGEAPAGNGKGDGATHPRDDQDEAERIDTARMPYNTSVRGGSAYLEVTTLVRGAENRRAPTLL